ncbi:MAG TPA: hypothetical protein VIL18_13080 [Longimicrobiales bacterium]
MSSRTIAARLKELREHVRANAENRPGVYRMLGPAGEVLYVGKSVRVRTRLLSYFRAPRGEKAAEIMAHAHHVEWDYTPSEFAALLREFEQIRRWRPIYNVEHKNDRAYAFIRITPGPAPKLVLVGQVTDGRDVYFGPFRGRQRVREALRELSDLLELRDCPTSVPMRFADQIDLFERDDTPRCLRGEIRRCLAPCAGRCTRAAYQARVTMARRFLQGDADRPLAILRERMRAAAERLQFEYAAELRDRAERLQQVRDELVALRGAVDSLTFAYPVPGYGGEDRVYLIRRGSVRADLPAPRTPAECEALAARAAEIYSAPEPRGLSVAAGQVPEILLIARWFRLRPEERARTVPVEEVLAARRTA